MVERCRRWKNNNRVSAYLFWSYLSYVISLIFGGSVHSQVLCGSVVGKQGFDLGDNEISGGGWKETIIIIIVVVLLLFYSEPVGSDLCLKSERRNSSRRGIGGRQRRCTTCPKRTTGTRVSVKVRESAGKFLCQA